MKKITVIGGGSTYTPELMEGLIMHNKVIGIDEVYLLDVPESEKFRYVVKLAERMAENAGSPFRVKSGFDSKEALTDADFIIQQYRPGFLEGRINDEKIPLKYDLIGQETTGIGGFSCALRALPIVQNYIEQIQQYANNNAWVINFTNPSGLISEFVINTMGFDRFAGLCNVPINIVQEIAEDMKCDRRDIFLKYYGLNHMTWIEKVFVKGLDRTEEALNDAFRPENIPDAANFEQFAEEMKMIFNPYLRYYYTTCEMLKEEQEAEKSKGTRGEQVREIEKELIRKYADETLKEKPEELTKRGGSMYSTAAVELLRDLCINKTNNHIVNVRNNGAIKNLDDDYVLEINATVSENSIRPVCAGEAYPSAKGLIDTVKQFERLTIEAHMNQSVKKAKEALIIHPLGPGLDVVDLLLEDILEKNSEFFNLK